jgi:ferritin heavy chain
MAGKLLASVAVVAAATFSTAASSISRQNYATTVEDAVNAHIMVEFKAGYQYAAISAYFKRDTVALEGIANFFAENSDEEFGHAKDFMAYQTSRGGRVVFDSVDSPVHEFPATDDKSDALLAFEMALDMEKSVNANLLKLSSLASEQNDPQLADKIDGYLSEQVEAIANLAKHVSNLQRIGSSGLGVYTFDKHGNF